MTISNVTSANVAMLYRAYGTPEASENNVRPDSPDAKGWDVQDKVEISEAGQQVSRLLEDVPFLDISREAIEEKSAALHGKLGSRFREAGVDTSIPIELTVDGRGVVRVVGDHPDKEKIEAIFADDRELSDDFREILVSTELRNAVERHMAFAEAYEKDPKAAVAQFAHLFTGGANKQVTFQFTEAELTSEYVKAVAEGNAQA